MTVGQRLREVRGTKTLNEFSEKLGVKASNISNIENGRSLMSVDLAIKISELYNVSLDWLLRGTGTRDGAPPQASDPKVDNNYITISKDELLDLYKRLNRKQEDEIDKLQGQIKVKNINPTSSES